MHQNKPNHSWWLLIAMVVIIVVLWANNAFAQDYTQMPVVGAGDDALTTAIKVLALVANLVLIPALVQWFRSKGHQIAEKDARILHSALNTAVNLTLNKSISREQKLEEGLMYVKVSAADAVSRLSPTDAHLQRMLTAYMNSKDMGLIVGELSTPNAEIGDLSVGRVNLRG